MACASPAVSAGPQGWLLSGVGHTSGDADRITDWQSLANDSSETSALPRLHLQHGPIDLIISADGRPSEVHAAYAQAGRCFQGLLDRLAAQLPRLRQRLRHDCRLSEFDGDVARRMYKAAMPHVASQVTPMIAVAGAVADHVLEHMLIGRELDRVQVNNGGDIALHLAPGQKSRIGICPSPMSSRYRDIVTLKASPSIGGVATSGWQGRSRSLGIADAVTVLAANAATADAAATLIANAIDLPESPKVLRAAASSLSPDSDLGDRLVTIDVQSLTRTEKNRALQAGVQCAQQMHAAGLLKAACLHLQGQSRVVGSLIDHLHPELESIGA